MRHPKPHTEKRDIIVKVRLRNDEAAHIDNKAERAGIKSRSEYLRAIGLGTGGHNPDLADIIGQLGLTLNTLEASKPASIKALRSEVRALTRALISAGCHARV